MRLLHVSKNRRRQQVKIGSVDGSQVNGSATIENSRSFASRNTALIGLLCISLIAIVYTYASLSGHTNSKTTALRNSSIQLTGTNGNNSTINPLAPDKTSTIDVVTNDSLNNGSGSPIGKTNTNVGVTSVNGGNVSTSVSVNGQSVTTSANGSLVQTSVNPDQTTTVDISNSHSNNGSATGFNATDQNLSIHSFSDSYVQEVE